MTTQYNNIPEVFIIHKRAGELKNCRLVRNTEDIPSFLTKPKQDTDGNPIEPAVTVLENGNVRMVAVEGPAERQFPFFLKWETTDKLAYGYGSWPKDNGFETLNYTEDGRCFDKAAKDEDMPRYMATAITDHIHEYFTSIEGVRIVDGVCEVKTSWGEVRKSKIPTDGSITAILIDYGDGANILTLSEPSAGDYYVEVDTRDVGRLVDIF